VAALVQCHPRMLLIEQSLPGLGPCFRTSSSLWLQATRTTWHRKVCLYPRPTRFEETTVRTLMSPVLVDVDHSMSIMKDETFGPVVGIMKVSRAVSVRDTV
jgi:hypothetical protein